jgi:hypothetical protein
MDWKGGGYFSAIIFRNEIPSSPSGPSGALSPAKKTKRQKRATKFSISAQKNPTSMVPSPALSFSARGFAFHSPPPVYIIILLSSQRPEPQHPRISRGESRIFEREKRQ